jgi:hypothetical protein
MTSNESVELRQYVAEQITDYITGQTTGTQVSPTQMKILENGVYNICATAYPEYEKTLSKQVPRIIRAALDMKQLGLSGKMKRIIDAAVTPKDAVISGMLNDITSAKSALNSSHNPVKNSWVNKLASEKSKFQDINNGR